MDIFRIPTYLFREENFVTFVKYIPRHRLQETVFIFSMRCLVAEIYWVRLEIVTFLTASYLIIREESQSLIYLA